MSSPPPPVLGVPPPPLQVDALALRALRPAERAFAFLLEGSPLGAERTGLDPSGAPRVHYDIAGRAEDVSTGRLRLETPAGPLTLRYALPAAIDLRPLEGEQVRVHTCQVLAEPGSFELRLHRADGRLGLFAFDGPPARLAGPFRLAFGPAPGALSLCVEGGAPLPLPPRRGPLLLAGQPLEALCLAASPARATFFLLG